MIATSLIIEGAASVVVISSSPNVALMSMIRPPVVSSSSSGTLVVVSTARSWEICTFASSSKVMILSSLTSIFSSANPCSTNMSSKILFNLSSA